MPGCEAVAASSLGAPLAALSLVLARPDALLVGAMPCVRR